MNRLKRKPWQDRGWMLGFLIPSVGMMVVMMICGYAPFGTKKAMLYSDMYHQYYPFFAAFRRVLRSGGSLLYNWDIGMGVDFLGMIAYYVASPLNLLSALVPDGWEMGYFCLLVPIKLGLAGGFFAMLLKKLYGRGSMDTALFGGFYGLCAWALGYQWNVMWLDTFALLPLAVMGMIALLEERRFILYTITLWLSVAANYYIGLFTCFFIFLSFFCYEFCAFRGWKRFFTDLVLMGVFSLLAIGMTAVLSYSALAALQTTQSSVNQFPTGFRLNIASRHDLLGLLDGMRQVTGNMGGGLEPSFKEGLPNLYCGVGSILLGLLFLLSDDVKWRKKLSSTLLLLFFCLSFLIRQLDYIWHGFHFPNMIPYRFSFLFSFVLLIMAYRGWMLRRRFDLLQIFAAAMLTGAIICCSNNLFDTQSAVIWGVSMKFHVYIIYNVTALVLYTAVLILGAWKSRAREETAEEYLRVRQGMRRRGRSSRIYFRMAALLELTATLVAFGCYFPGTGISDYPRGGEEAASMFRYLREREEDGAFYRTEVAHTQTLNDDALNNYSGISAFTSSANVHITEFLKALGYGAKNTYNRYAFEESSPVANLFLNLKYMMDREGKDKTSAVFEPVHHFGRVSLYRNTAYLPLGFLAEPELALVNFGSGDDSFGFQNTLFQAATQQTGEVWFQPEGWRVDIVGNGAEVSRQPGSAHCSYSDPVSGSNVIYTYEAERDGFACVRLDLPKRNDFYVSVNGVELYRETISLPQMLAIGDVHQGDVIDIRILCKSGENGTATVNLAIMDNDLFWQGYNLLNSCVMNQTSFTDTRMTGQIDCNRDGLLYTSIPQNGNWKVYVDGEPRNVVLIGDCMIGVTLNRGSHEIAFVYENQAFRLGVMISASCAAMFVILAVLRYRKRKE